VLDLRTKYAQPRKELMDIERYVDADFLDAALR